MAQPEIHKNHNTTSLDDLHGKLTNFDAEIAVIGCFLWDNKSYEKVADF